VEWKEIMIIQNSIKTQVIPKKYVKIAKNQIKNLQIKNKEVYKILLESQVKEKPIAYTKWETLHTRQSLSFTILHCFNNSLHGNIK
jgi:hypothetical protein